MIPAAKHFYRPDEEDRVAAIQVEASADRDLYVVVVQVGPSSEELRQTAVHGPYAEDELAAAFTEAVDDLRGEGFWPGGILALLEALDDPSPAVRARAAIRLGWRRCSEAVDKLLAMLPASVDESCAILDALGAIGDTRAIVPLRDYAARKLLSRRRSAVEALRQLDDAQGLNEARQRARERLPAPVLAALDAADGSKPLATEALALGEALQTLDPGLMGPALDTLYELATPVALATLRLVRDHLSFAAPHLWRNVKSIFKRSMLRHDPEMFGWLAHAIEAQGRTSTGTVASVKSGYDGQQRSMRIFGRKTQDFLRRLTWRYLRDLAAHRPEAYAPAAAEALLHYSPDEVKGPRFGHCYLLHRILLGNSKRYRFDGRGMAFHLRSAKLAQVPADVREEAYPELWDLQPRAYLRVLTASPLPEVHVFGLRGVAAHPAVIHTANHADMLALLGAPYEPTVQLGLRELDRRFDPARPDWSLLRYLLADGRPMARTIGQRWLRLTAALWLRDAELILDFLAAENPNVRAMVVEMAGVALSSNPELRRALAARVVQVLRAPEVSPGMHDGYAQLAREVLAAELAGLVSVVELANWVETGSSALKIAAGHLLRGRPEAVRELGLERLAALAQHEIAAVRAAAAVLIRSAVNQLAVDPSLLFVLAESEWEDTRTLAFDLLRNRIGLESLGLDGLTGLLDSNLADVQEVGKELAIRHIAAVSAAELVFRLVQHPDPRMRRFALDLVVQHLPEGPEALGRLKTFCRSALLDLWPDAKVKRLVVDFLTVRGIEDAGQAEIAGAILGDAIRLQGRSDFEHVLQGLVRLKLAHPEVPMTVRLQPGI